MVHFVDDSEYLVGHLVVEALLVFELDAELHVLLFEDLVEFVDFLHPLVQLVCLLLLLVQLFVQLEHLLFQSIDEGLLGL